MKRKVLYGIITVFSILFILIFCSNKVEAATTNPEEKTIEYNKEISYIENDDGTVAVKAANKQITNATIPETINGKKVTAIALNGFCDCELLKTVTIPDTVEDIRSGAFYGCTSLTSISIPDSVKSLGKALFTDCISLTNVKLPNSMTELTQELFMNCKSLKDIKIPESVTSMSSYVFFGCTSLKKINLPSKLENIGWCGFEGSGLESIVLPDSVKMISSWAFGYCESLKSIYIPKGIKVIYNEEDGKAFGKIPASQLTIYGYKGTVAQTVAESEGYKFVERVIPFLDVKSTDWYYNSVKYVYENKMIYGSNAYTFNPNGKLTRGMLVTILWRMEGSKKVNGKAYPDVKETEYYYEAIKWASANKIVNGYKDGKFKPNNNITREQLATILMNYANYKNKNTNSRADLSKFKDNNGISSYAKNAVSWAVSKKVMSGKENGTKVDPRGTATRAEASAMLANYCTYIGK